MSPGQGVEKSMNDEREIHCASIEWGVDGAEQTDTKKERWERRPGELYIK